MTRLLLITLLVLSHGPAYAEWVVVAKDITEDGATTYADPDTIRRKGKLVKMWVLFDFKTVQTVPGVSFLSSMLQEQFDCADERTRTVWLMRYSGNMGTGDIGFEDDGEQKWRPVPPWTVDEALWTFACAKQRSRST